MKRILVGLFVLSLFTALALVPKAVSQTITITVNPTIDDSYWVWNDEYQCWIWNGPEFEGVYEGHPYSYWHGRHHEEWGRDHRPRKGESSKGERPVNKGNVEQPKAEQPKTEMEKPKEQQGRTEVEQPNAEEKAKTQNAQVEQKSKAEKPKPEKEKDDPKPKGE
jgi:hypothetical protein